MTDPQQRHDARTWAHGAFDAAELAAGRRDRVSVIIPARDEEATVGHVVHTLRSTLVEDVALIDELVVVDGHSTDATARVAAAAGARVVDQTEILAELGAATGKGEALWKGLATTTGDLVVFIDADIHDIGPRFVTGLLGPLLTEPDVAFVKATYDRPFLAGGAVAPTGGGRVTELVARPLIATFWPELSWLTQPLSGEYAGRRDLLESLPFVQGYGVEIALLIDIAEQHGVDRIAQVDLGRRVHEHQPLAALGRMAAEILQVALERAGRSGRASYRDAFGDVLAQPRRRDDGATDLELHTIRAGERPPLRDVTTRPPRD